MHSLVSLIQRYVLSKAGSSVIGLFVVISLIWYAGPMLGLESVSYRLIIIGAIVLIVTIVWGFKRYIAHRRGALLQDDLSSQNDNNTKSKKLEIQLLKEKMNEAISSLKSSELGARYRGNAALYALPWYMIIGPSAAGKSTLLRQSGLHFPYSNEEDIHIKGYGGTRNCDWWFSDQAVILDTAGRYTTEEDDRDEWTSFLGLLKKHRRRMPINGVLVAISLPDLLTTDKKGLNWHVKVIRNRISELIQQLGMVFPVHIVFTKCDLLIGFEAYFEDMSEQERAQVWGTYLYDKYQENITIAEIFSQNLQTLYNRLCAMRLRRVSMQRNISRKTEMFDFPNQFKAAIVRLDEFVHLLFKDNPYQETPQFAGVYFTSATQEGTPIERVIGSLREAFGITHKSAEKVERIQRPYFIKKLFTDVIFQIQGGIRSSRRKLNYQRGFRTISVLASLMLLGGAYIFLSGSYATNSYVLNQGEKLSRTVTEDVMSNTNSVHKRFLSIAGLYVHYLDLLNSEKKKNISNKSTLFRADEQLDAVRKVLLEGLQYAYWEPVSKEIESKLLSYSLHWDDALQDEKDRVRSEYYDLLTLYLRLTQTGKFDFEEVLPSTQILWQELVTRDGKISSDSIISLQEMSKLYLETKITQSEPYWIANRVLVKKVQDQLRIMPDADMLYAQLIKKASKQWKDMYFYDFVTGTDGDYINAKSKVSGIYTADAWYTYIKPEIDQIVKTITDGDWVLDGKLSATPNKMQSTESTSAVNLVELNTDGAKVEHETGLDENEADSSTIDKEGTAALLAQQIEQQIRRHYFSDYSLQWINFLKSINYKLPDDLREKSRALMILSSDDGPISQLSQTIANNIYLFETKPIPVEKLDTSAENELIKAVETPRRVSELVPIFADLEKFTVPQSGNKYSKQTTEYLKALRNVYGEVDGMAASVDIGRDSERFVSNILSGNSSGSKIPRAWVTATTIINSVQADTRQILEGILSPPIRMAWSGIVNKASSELENEWVTSVVRPYKSMIVNKFPFYSTGDDAALADVAEFYRPNDGVLWSFVNDRLSPYLRHTGKGWEARKWLGTGANFSKKFLVGLDLAQKITDALYTHRDSDPKMTFFLQPDPNSGLREMQLESNGQLYRYRNGPQIWQRFDWPGDMQQIGARVMGIADDGRAMGELRAEGPWGLFHLLSQADIKKVAGTHYKTIWKLPSSDGGTVTVAFKLRADREDNIFNLKLINTFRLPGSLFSGARSGRLAAY